MEALQTMQDIEDSPVVTLTNGLRVANFSSPHPFKFVDGTTLPACAEARSRALMLDAREQTLKSHATQTNVSSNGMHVHVPFTDIILRWEMTEAVAEALVALQADQNVDIVLVPLPVMTALKEGGYEVGKARVIRVADRVTKEIYIDRFCR